jgi:hypothetical protein
MRTGHKKWMGKRGQIIQIAFILFFIFIAAVLVLTYTKIMNNFWSAISETGGLNNSNIAKVKATYDTFPKVFDYSVMLLIVGLTIGLVITSFLIPSHPIFLLVNIIGIFILVLVSMVFSNMYGQLIAGIDAPFAIEAESFPLSIFIMQYLPYACIIITILTTIVMFAKGQSSGGGYNG